MSRVRFDLGAQPADQLAEHTLIAAVRPPNLLNQFVAGNRFSALKAQALEKTLLQGSQVLGKVPT